MQFSAVSQRSQVYSFSLIAYRDLWRDEVSQEVLSELYHMLGSRLFCFQDMHAYWCLWTSRFHMPEPFWCQHIYQAKRRQSFVQQAEGYQSWGCSSLLPEEGICCFSLICTSIGCYSVFTSGRQNLYAELRNLFHVAAQVFESLALWMRVLGMKRKLVRKS